VKDVTIDTERVMQKIAFIREQLGDIKTLTSAKNRSEILNDKILVKGLKYSLQTAIEAMIDIAFHIAAKKYNYAPEETRDAFRILRKNEVIGEEEFKTFSAMVGFRNRMVHLYQNVSDERVYEFSTTELNDFEVFINRVMVLSQIKE
jgi:uncharacterized protein YutE (UPF0331/DUF86 family)